MCFEFSFLHLPVVFQTSLLGAWQTPRFWLKTNWITRDCDLICYKRMPYQNIVSLQVCFERLAVCMYSSFV